MDKEAVDTARQTSEYLQMLSKGRETTVRDILLGITIKDNSYYPFVLGIIYPDIFGEIRMLPNRSCTPLARDIL